MRRRAILVGSNGVFADAAILGIDHSQERFLAKIVTQVTVSEESFG